MNLTIRIARQTAGAYRAWCPALPGCTVVGQSMLEVQSKIHDAVRTYVDKLEETLPRELGRLLAGELKARCQTGLRAAKAA
jgi:predicted RNase H-like HicB family nuclease